MLVLVDGDEYDNGKIRFSVPEKLIVHRFHVVEYSESLDQVFVLGSFAFINHARDFIRLQDSKHEAKAEAFNKSFTESMIGK